jgi:hypothetical protein
MSWQVLSQLPIGSVVVSVVAGVVVKVAGVALVAKNVLDVVCNLPGVVLNEFDVVVVVLELTKTSRVVLDTLGLA